MTLNITIRFDPADLLLTFGDHNKDRNNEALPSVDRQPSEIVLHPDFDEVTYENDLALLYVVENVSFAKHILPVCLPSPDEGRVAGTFGFATGWGTEYEGRMCAKRRRDPETESQNNSLSLGGPKPSVLQEVSVPIMDYKKCNEIFLEADLEEDISDVFICAGFEEGGKDACEVSTISIFFWLTHNLAPCTSNF